MLANINVKPAYKFVWIRGVVIARVGAQVKAGYAMVMAVLANR